MNMLQISSCASMSLCYLSRACHSHFCDAHVGFLVGAVGVSYYLCLCHLKVALVSPWMEDSSIGPLRWNSWCMKEKKPCFVVGDVKVIIFVGNNLNFLSYYGIMDNNLIKCMCVLWKQDVGGGGAYPYYHPWLSIHWLPLG